MLCDLCGRWSDDLMELYDVDGRIFRLCDVHPEHTTSRTPDLLTSESPRKEDHQ